MAGHSQFKNIMYRKGAQDAKRSKLFSRLAREVTVAAREGLPDADKNPRLRTAIANARAENMPKDKIQRAISRATGDGDGVQYEEIRYEGYGPGGVAMIVETLTDNRNRTAAEVRSAFSKHAGSLGETGSVAFLFDRMGEILFVPETGTADEMLEGAIEAGAQDVGIIRRRPCDRLRPGGPERRARRARGPLRPARERSARLAPADHGGGRGGIGTDAHEAARSARGERRRPAGLGELRSS